MAADTSAMLWAQQIHHAGSPDHEERPMLRAAVGTSFAVLAMALGVAAGCSGDEDAAGTAPGPPERNEVSVPDLVGLNPEQAVARLCSAGLSIGDVAVVERTPEVGRRPAAALAASRVRGTEPGPGRSVPVGTGIDLRISLASNAALAFQVSC